MIIDYRWPRGFRPIVHSKQKCARGVLKFQLRIVVIHPADKLAINASTGMSESESIGICNEDSKISWGDEAVCGKRKPAETNPADIKHIGAGILNLDILTTPFLGVICPRWLVH